MPERPSVEGTRKRDYSLPLNGYRGWCALSVFLFHLGSARVVEPANFGPSVAFYWGALRLGVEMFFMISGYVILGSLLRHASVGSFLRDRFVRIYAAWVPSLVAVTVICAAFHMKAFESLSPAQSLGLFIANFLLLPPIVPLPLIHWGSWSLSFEWVFYLLASAAALIWRGPARSKWLPWFWGLAVMAFVARYPRSLFFLTGVIVFMHAAWFERHKRLLRWPVLSFFVFLSAWRLSGFDEGDCSDSLATWVDHGRGVWGVIAAFASLHMFASVVQAASVQTRFLESRAFQFCGKISYSFYLWHALVMALVKRPIIAFFIPRYGTAAGFALFCVLSTAISLGVSWLSWHFCEDKLARSLRSVLAKYPRSAAGSGKLAPTTTRAAL
jgi:peptidoglycan/LPS O-acetylase OafA/YrhL